MSGAADDRATAAMLRAIRPTLPTDDGLLEAMREALASGWITNGGPHVRAFEAELAAFLGHDDVALVSDGTSALWLPMLRAVQTGKLRARGPDHAVDHADQRVALPSFTYVATANAIEHSGLEPVFCDIDPVTWTLDPHALDALLGAQPDVRAAVAVNVYGVPPDLASLAAVCEAHGALLLYDNAHGMGTTALGSDGLPTRRVPAGPWMTGGSLHATKVLPAVEGGWIAGAPDDLAAVRALRRHGLGDAPLDAQPGHNAKMSELHALVGRWALRRLPQDLERRQSYLARAREALIERGNGAFAVQGIPTGVTLNGQNLGVVVHAATRVGMDRVVAAFAEHGVEARRYFWPALHRMARFADERFAPGRLAETERVADRVVCLPLHAEMSDAELEQLEAAIVAVGAALAS